MHTTDLTGVRFGLLSVVRRSDPPRKNSWLCRCDCGKERDICPSNLLQGFKSCGCQQVALMRASKTKHGCSGNSGDSTTRSRAYIAWQCCKQRCCNPRDQSYPRYGGRGIKVCQRWLDSFDNFQADMGDCPPSHTLDRKDNGGDYCPENCRWATHSEQSRNRSSALFVEFRGNRRLLIELCEEHHVSYNLVFGRIRKLGWSVEKALTTPSLRAKQSRHALP